MLFSRQFCKIFNDFFIQHLHGGTSVEHSVQRNIPPSYFIHLSWDFQSPHYDRHSCAAVIRDPFYGDEKAY